jgi:hypothetical protein
MNSYSLQIIYRMEYFPTKGIAHVPAHDLVPGQRYIIEPRGVRNRETVNTWLGPLTFITKFRGIFRGTIQAKYDTDRLETFAHFTNLEIMLPSNVSRYELVSGIFLNSQLAKKNGKYIVKDQHEIPTLLDSEGVAKLSIILDKLNVEKEGYFFARFWYFGQEMKESAKKFVSIIDNPEEVKQSQYRSLRELGKSSSAAARAVAIPGIAEYLGIPPIPPSVEETEEHERLKKEIKEREKMFDEDKPAPSRAEIAEMKENGMMGIEDKPAGGSKKSKRRKRRTHKRTRGRR